MKTVQIITATIIAFSASVVMASSDCQSRSNAGRFANTNPKSQSVKTSTQVKTQSVKTVRGAR